MSRHAGNHAQQVLHRAELAHLLQLIEKIIQTEGTGRQLFSGLACLLLIELLLRLLDKRHDVAHIENARRHTVGVEDLEVLQPLAGGGEQDRLAGHGRHGQRGTATGVAIKLGQHHAGEVHALIEGLGGLHGILTDHRIDDEQNLIRLHGIANIARLLHQLLIHAETAGGIDDHRVIQLLLGEFHGVTSDLHRVASGLAWSHDRFAAIGLHALLRRIHRHIRAFANHLQLCHCVRALQIGRNQQRRVAGILQPVAELAGKRGLTSALKTRKHDDGRRILREVQRSVNACAQNARQLLVDDLDDLLRGIEGLGDLGAQRAFADAGGEGTDHVERHVGVEQCTADFADGAVDIGLGKLTFALQVLERTGEPVCQRTKCCHNVPKSSRRAGNIRAVPCWWPAAGDIGRTWPHVGFSDPFGRNRS